MLFFWNARARNTHVEATLNHPFAAQAWLEAAERVVPLKKPSHDGNLSAPATLSAGELRVGLEGLLRAEEDADAARLRSVVEAASSALAAFAREPADFGALELRELRAANARAAAVAGEVAHARPSDADLVDFASDRRDGVVFKVARRVDGLLRRRGWRVHDLLAEASKFDDVPEGAEKVDSAKATPRALCRALRAWRLFEIADAGEAADYARFIGEPRPVDRAPAPAPASQERPASRKQARPRAARARVDPFVEAKKRLLKKPLKRAARPAAKPRGAAPDAASALRQKRDAPPPAPARAKAPPARGRQTPLPPRPPPPPQDDEAEADLLVQLENALVKMASKISNIESKLDQQEGA